MIRTAIFTIAAAIAFVAPASADPYKDRPTRVVSIADLDLSNPVDQQELAKRVEDAAKYMCREEPTRIGRRVCALETIDYTMKIVEPQIRRAYVEGGARPQRFALAARN